MIAIFQFALEYQLLIGKGIEKYLSTRLIGSVEFRPVGKCASFFAFCKERRKCHDITKDFARTFDRIQNAGRLWRSYVTLKISETKNSSNLTEGDLNNG